jgi:NAD-dependent deacetylase
MQEQLRDVVGHLHRAQRVLFITGAGLSADSGLPTYRGVGGLYEDRETAEEVPIEEILSGDTLSCHPELTWKYLFEIEKACRGAEPNEGHKVIARVEERKPGSLVLTQNVDGLHRAAGTGNLVEIHGRFSELFCVESGCTYRETVADYAWLSDVPRCPRCAGLVRPDVVLFGEMLPQAALSKLEYELNHGFDIVFSVGTSSLFPYITEPVLVSKRQGIPTVEINPGETVISSLVDYKLTGGAAEVLARLWEQFLRTENSGAGPPLTSV